MEWTGPLLSFGSSVVVAVITATLTVRFALRRFYAEKWWERKSATYTAIIEALHHVKNYAETNLTSSLLGRYLTEQRRQDLNEKLQGAMTELRKQLDIGDFVISEEAVVVMNKLMAELDASSNTENWQEHLELTLSAINNCLSSMRRIARKDLRIM